VRASAATRGERGTLAALGLLAVVVLAGCGAADPPADSGVEGTVSIGPMCPVVQVGQDCPDKPYAAELTVANLHGKILARAAADADGRYRFMLAAGEYILEAHPADNSPFPMPATLSFTVAQGRWTRLDVALDSGIR